MTVKLYRVVSGILFVIALLCPLMHGMPGGDNKDKDNDKESNLPDILIPTPLFAFGQDIIPQGATSEEELFFHLTGNTFFDFSFEIRLIHGATDNLALIMTLPLLYDHEVEDQKIFGAGDLIIGCEYAFYNDIDKEKKHLTRLTVTPYVYLPSGNPQLDRESTSFFLGGTIAHVTEKWYAFWSTGIRFPSSRENIHFKYNVFYQWGFGHTFFYSDRLFAHLMVEFEGEYNAAPIINGVISPDPTQRENIALIGPTFLFGTSWLTVYIGYQYPISRRIRPFVAESNIGLGLDFYFEF